MELSVKKEIIDWCNQQVDEGKELKFTWDGGSDSGYAELLLDDEQVSNEFSDALMDGIYEELDYGSWAGEFSASGEAVYSKEEQAFEGTDYYEETDTVGHFCSIILNIPSTLWYDTIQIRIETEDEYVNENDITVRFIVKNGFLTEEHTNVAQMLEDQLLNDVSNEVEMFSKNNCFRSIWETIELKREEGVSVPGFVKHEITNINMGTVKEEEKIIYLKLIDENEE